MDDSTTLTTLTTRQTDAQRKVGDTRLDRAEQRLSDARSSVQTIKRGPDSNAVTARRTTRHLRAAGLLGAAGSKARIATTRFRRFTSFFAGPGNPEALAVLSHALGENVHLQGGAGQAVRHFTHGREQLRPLALPTAGA